MAERAMQRRPGVRPPAEPAGAGIAGPSHGRLVQLAAALNGRSPKPPTAQNRTGLPDGLKAGVEALSGVSLDAVRVRRGSPEPARMQAEAFAQGNEIHLAPGQEQHLPHEAWHVAQQAQGRVRPTTQLKGGVPVNDDNGLEREADVMGARALATPAESPPAAALAGVGPASRDRTGVVQRVGGVKLGIKRGDTVQADDADLKKINDVIQIYKDEIKKKKVDAKKAFLGKEKDIGAQGVYTAALKAAEMDIDELAARIRKIDGVKVTGTFAIRRKSDDAFLGRILTGDGAYLKTEDASGEIVHDLHAKYDSRTANNLKGASEYIRIDGRMLRRYAFRGVTPIEIEQIPKGGAVKPLFHADEDRKVAQVGMHFTPVTGLGFARESIPDKQDLAYMQKFSNIPHISPAMFGFVHGRKGVGKFFSLRSTPGDITSNHGASFSGFGDIKLDLAKVPADNFVFHYAGGGASALSSGVDATNITNKTKHDEELTRARESVLRNREIILKEYPAAAVVGAVPSPIKESDVKDKGFKDGYDGVAKPDFALFRSSYDLAYGQGQARRQLDTLRFQNGFSQGSKDKTAGLKFRAKKFSANPFYIEGYRKAFNA